MKRQVEVMTAFDLYEAAFDSANDYAEETAEYVQQYADGAFDKYVDILLSAKRLQHAAVLTKGWILMGESTHRRTTHKCVNHWKTSSCERYQRACTPPGCAVRLPSSAAGRTQTGHCDVPPQKTWHCGCPRCSAGLESGRRCEAGNHDRWRACTADRQDSRCCVSEAYAHENTSIREHPRG